MKIVWIMVLFEDRGHKKFSRSRDAEYRLLGCDAGVLTTNWRVHGAGFFPFSTLLATRDLAIILLILVGNVTNKCLGSGRGS